MTSSTPYHDFGEVRSALDGTPSRRAWERVCGTLQMWSAARVRDHLPYMQNKLATWPAHLLCAPAEWVTRVAEGEEVPEMRLATEITASGRKPWSAGQLAAVAASLEGVALRGVRVRGAVLKGRRFEEFFAAIEPACTHLRALYVLKGGIGLTGLECLGEHSCFDGLTTLSLEREYPGAWGVEALAKTSRWANLERLSLRQNFLDGAEIAALWESIYLKPQWLELGFNRIDACDVWSPAILDEAEVLDLQGAIAPESEDADEIVAALLRGCTPGRLRHLDVSDNRLGADVMEVIAASDALAGVESLVVSGNPIEDIGLRLLLDSPHLKSVTRLKATDCDLTDDGAFMLTQSTALRMLQHLDVGKNDIGERGAAALKACAHTRRALGERGGERT